MCTRAIDETTIEFGTTGYTKDHVFVLYDRDTESIWYPMSDDTLDAVAGARHGRALTFVAKPSRIPLGRWLDEHPDTTILVPNR